MKLWLLHCLLVYSKCLKWPWDSVREITSQTLKLLFILFITVEIWLSMINQRNINLIEVKKTSYDRNASHMWRLYADNPLDEDSLL